MLDKWLGNSTTVNPVQLKNAELPMLVKSLGKVIFFNSVLPANAESSIRTTACASITSGMIKLLLFSSINPLTYRLEKIYTGELGCVSKLS